MIRARLTSLFSRRGAAVVVLSLGLLAAFPVPAPAAENFKIGFVNLERLYREGAPFLRAQKKLEKEFQPREQELQKMEKQVKDLQGQLEKEGMTMPESERRKKERDLAELSREFQRKLRELREDGNLRKNEEYMLVLERANKAVRAIAEQEKFDLILQEAVYVSTKIDITDKVLKALAADK